VIREPSGTIKIEVDKPGTHIGNQQKNGTENRGGKGYSEPENREGVGILSF
jgi:hypothetical protein